MFSIDVVYLFLNICLLSIFLYSGYQISKGKPYMDYCVLCVISFTLVLGLRYGRGNDYLYYVIVYTQGYIEGHHQLVFSWINGTLKWLGVGKYYIFLFYSFIEIVCALIFLRRYRRYGMFIFPFFLLATIFFDEYQIRQSLGFALGLLCLNYFFKVKSGKHFLKWKNIENILVAVLFFSISYSIHAASGYILIIIIVLHCILRTPIPLYISIPVLIFSAYFFSEWFDFRWLNPILNTFADSDDLMSGYIERSEKYFSMSGSESKYTRNPIVLFFEVCGTLSLYYLGAKIVNMKNRQEVVTYYNVFVIGTIVLNAFRTLEILNRVGQDLALFWFFPLSFILYYRKVLFISKLNKMFALFLLWWVYDYLKYLFMRGDMTLFIWNR